MHTSNHRLIAAAVTLFTDSGHVDYDATSEYLRWLLDKPIDSVLLAGTTGEYASMTTDERVGLIEAAAELGAQERMFAHVGAQSEEQACLIAAAAADAGFENLLTCLPFGMVDDASQITVRLESILSAAGGANLYLYIFPTATGTEVSANTLTKLTEMTSLKGAKISGLTDHELAPYLRLTADSFEIYQGNDATPRRTFAETTAGIVSGHAAVIPELFDSARHSTFEGQEDSETDQKLTRLANMVQGRPALLKVLLARRIGCSLHTRGSSYPSQAEILDACSAFESLEEVRDTTL